MQTEIYTAAVPQPALDGPCTRLGAVPAGQKPTGNRRRTTAKQPKNTKTVTTAAASKSNKPRRRVDPVKTEKVAHLKDSANREDFAVVAPLVVPAVAEDFSVVDDILLESSLSAMGASLARNPSPDASAHALVTPPNQMTSDPELAAELSVHWQPDSLLKPEAECQAGPALTHAPVEKAGDGPTSSRSFAATVQSLGKALLALFAQSWSYVLQRLKSQQAKKRLRVCETVSLGEKRFIAVIQVDGDQFLVGGSSSSVSTLAHLEQPRGFPEVLRQSCEGGTQA